MFVLHNTRTFTTVRLDKREVLSPILIVGSETMRTRCIYISIYVYMPMHEWMTELASTHSTARDGPHE